MSEKDSNDYWLKITESEICLSRLMREDEINAVKIGMRFQYKRPSREEEQRNKVIKVVEFFTKRGYSLLDVLIRCSTENTIIYTTRYIADILSVEFMPYNILWKIMEKVGLFKKFHVT